MSEAREVVITGLGIVSPIGIGREAFVKSLRSRTSGVAPITHYDVQHLAVKIGAELKDFQAKLYVKPRKSLKVMSREIQMGVASAALAMEDANLDAANVDPERFGVVYGCPMLYADNPELADLYKGCAVDGEFDFDKFGEQFQKQMIPLWMLKYLPNMTASHIGIAHGARGPNNSIVQGDCSSLLAMIEAISVIQRGVADLALTGGAGDRMDITPVLYRGDRNLSHRNDEPERASRPFDADRDGMVIGEGASTIVLESRDHAEKRGAKILGSVLGYASTHAGTMTAETTEPMMRAIERSIRCSLEKARIEPSDVGHVNAHGSSEIAQDSAEANAIDRVLPKVPVTAPKSYFGNVGAASGTLELSASLALDAIPPTLNYENPDSACPVPVTTSPAVSQSPVVIKLNQNSTGQAVSVVVRRGD